MIVMLVALVGVLVGGGFAAYNWIQNSAYLIEEKGMVAIYQGIPDDIPGIETHTLVEITDMNIDDVPPSAQNHIRSGMPVESVEQAKELVSEYERQAKEDAAAHMAHGSVATSSSSSSSTKGSRS